MSSTTRARFRAAIVAITPAWLLAAFVYHPYIAKLTDKTAVAARFVPLGAALYVGGVAGIVALWPLAYEMWKHPPEAARPAGQAQPTPAT